MESRKMFKVISPVEKRGGGKWWMRCGSGFLNKDESINIYLDALPLGGSRNEGVTLQLRELTEDELRERAEKRSSFAPRGQYDANGLPSSRGSYGGSAPPGRDSYDGNGQASSASENATDVPF